MTFARDMTVSEIERLRAAADAADVPFEMDEEAFKAFYERTAKGVLAYLTRLTRDAHAAEDLLQDTYYRFLRAATVPASESHRRAYLFRIATNLARDRYRRAAAAPTLQLGDRDVASRQEAVTTDQRADLDRAMRRLRPRERALIWLAYGVGQPHAEIADALGVKTGSVKLLLFRARRRLAGFLRGTTGASSGGHVRDDR